MAPFSRDGNWTRRLALAGLVSLAAGCASTRGGNIPYGAKGFGAPDPVSTLSLDTNYKIAPLDVLSVNVFQVKEFSGSYQVDLTGHIALPLIGNILAASLTTDEVKQSISSRLEASYVKNPDVTVGIASSAGSNVTVEGSVKQPGVFPVLTKITLIQAIAMAHGPDDTANERRVAVFRRINGKQAAAAFDLVSIRRGEADDPEIYRGDIIVVDGSNTKKAYRDFLRSMPIVSLFAPLGL